MRRQHDDADFVTFSQAARRSGIGERHLREEGATGKMANTLSDAPLTERGKSKFRAA